MRTPAAGSTGARYSMRVGKGSEQRRRLPALAPLRSEAPALMVGIPELPNQPLQLSDPTAPQTFVLPDAGGPLTRPYIIDDKVALDAWHLLTDGEPHASERHHDIADALKERLQAGQWRPLSRVTIHREPDESTPYGQIFRALEVTGPMGETIAYGAGLVLSPTSVWTVFALQQYGSGENLIHVRQITRPAAAPGEMSCPSCKPLRCLHTELAALPGIWFSGGVWSGAVEGLVADTDAILERRTRGSYELRSSGIPRLGAAITPAATKGAWTLRVTFDVTPGTRTRHRVRRLVLSRPLTGRERPEVCVAHQDGQCWDLALGLRMLSFA